MYKSLTLALLMKTLVLRYPELKNLTREERNIIFKQARPKLNAVLKSKRDSLLRLMLNERMRDR